MENDMLGSTVDTLRDYDAHSDKVSDLTSLIFKNRFNVQLWDDVLIEMLGANPAISVSTLCIQKLMKVLSTNKVVKCVEDINVSVFAYEVINDMMERIDFDDALSDAFRNKSIQELLVLETQILKIVRG